MCKDYQKDFEAGLYTKVRPDRFDSVSEKKVCLILNRILKDYGLEKMMQIRLTPQQALDNYVEVIINCEEEDVEIPREGEILFSRHYIDTTLLHNGILIRRIHS